MKNPFRKSVAKAAPVANTTQEVVRRGIFSTDLLLDDKPLAALAAQSRRKQAALSATFQRGAESFRMVDGAGNSLAQAVGQDSNDAVQAVAMDDSLSTQKMINSTGGFIPTAQLEWYGTQGFIGWQTCAVIAQNWLVDKACDMPGKDAIRHWLELTVNDGTDVDPKVLDLMRRLDKRFGIKKHCREFVKMGRVFGIRHALFLVDGIDYSAPFNIDGVRPGSYKGISQIDPYWITPVLDGVAASNPADPHFYEPTWWMIQGKRVHRSHLVIMRNGEVPDILKPSYFYGGIPVPQKVFERVYAAERTANEAPILAMTKRMTTFKVDTSAGISNFQQFMQKMENWSAMMNNMGIKTYGENEEINQFDTNLSGLDETIMTQYQLVAAASGVPATKLLGTTPKGFNSTGEYEESSYHEELESIQEHDLQPLVDRHHQLVMKAFIAPEYGAFSIESSWNPVDSPTAAELAEINLKKSQTAGNYVNAGAVDGFDVRQSLINDKDSGFHGIPDVVEGGVGDREAEAEMKEAALEASSPEKDNAVSETEAKADAQDEALTAPSLTRADVMDMINAQPAPAPSIHQIQPVINITNAAPEQKQVDAPVVNVTMPDIIVSQPAIQIDNHIPQQKQGDVNINMPEQKPAQVNVNMPDVKVNVAAPSVTVDNVVQPADVKLSMPKRITETKVEYDRAGNIASTVQTEKDA